MNYVLNESKMYADVTEGTAIIINSETGIYYGLNPFGTAIYENIAAGASIEEIKTALSAVAGAPADITAKVDAFVADLLNREILECSPESSAEVTIDTAVAEADGYSPECTEYADAQALLLADPIHEVKEEEGWTPYASSLDEDGDDVARRKAKMEQ